jgi:hypothetical protein
LWTAQLSFRVRNRSAASGADGQLATWLNARIARNWSRLPLPSSHASEGRRAAVLQSRIGVLLPLGSLSKTRKQNNWRPQLGCFVQLHLPRKGDPLSRVGLTPNTQRSLRRQAARMVDNFSQFANRLRRPTYQLRAQRRNIGHFSRKSAEIATLAVRRVDSNDRYSRFFCPMLDSRALSCSWTI